MWLKLKGIKSRELSTKEEEISRGERGVVLCVFLL